MVRCSALNCIIAAFSFSFLLLQLIYHPALEKNIHLHWRDKEDTELSPSFPHSSVRSFSIAAKLEAPDDVLQLPGHITLGLTIINKRGETELEEDFEYKMKQNLVSLLTHSSGTPLHLVVITDKNSITNLARTLQTILEQYTAEMVISTKWTRFRGLPKIKFSFVDCEAITKVDEEFFTAMRNNSKQGFSVAGSYTEDLFYIAPIYHKAFPNLTRIIFLDSKDLEFRSDIQLLDEQFELMSASACIGIGPDLTPHYRATLGHYRDQHPDTQLGLPGTRQGFNSGVVLYRLDRMRASPRYNWYTTRAGVEELVARYGYTMFLAEQDWLTNLGWTEPDLFYNLPCTFNRQTSISMLTPQWADLFDTYHGCHAPSAVHVFHRNGCGPTPRACHSLDSLGAWAGSGLATQLRDLHVHVLGVWDSLAELRAGRVSGAGAGLSKLSYLINDVVIMNCVLESQDYCMKVKTMELPIN